MKKLIIKIANILNEQNIMWAVASSMVLVNRGIIKEKEANGIDLLIDITKFNDVEKELQNLGIKNNSKNRDNFYSDKYCEFIIDNCFVSIMSNVKIEYDKTIYNYVFTSKNITDIEVIDNVIIYYSALEDWYIMYHMMKNKEDKIKKIEKYFKENSSLNLEASYRTLKGMPEEIKKIIKEKIRSF